MAKKKTNILYVLPGRVKAAKDAIVFDKKKAANKASKFLFKLIKDAMQDNDDLEKFREVPANYFRKAYGGGYKEEFLDSLVLAGIVQVNRSYSTGTDNSKPYCMSYRIHPDLLNQKDSFVKDSFINEREQDSLDDDRYVIFNRDYKIEKMERKYIVTSASIAYMLHKIEKAALKTDLVNLSYNLTAFRNKAEELARNICYTNFKIDDEIEENFFTVSNHITCREHEHSRVNHIKWVRREGYSLIQDKNKFYIDDLDKYIQRKKGNILLNYTYYASMIEKGIFYLTRNDSNNRLDHNLTSINSDIMDIIKKDNDLSELDMCNSQFTIHAHWLKEEGFVDQYEDVREYYQLCTTNNLYQSIAYMLHKTRAEAKSLMLMMAFSSHKNNTGFKSLFKKRFPTVIKHMDDYKKENGKNAFAIELQKREAKIFIDDIYSSIKEQGFFCLTKHDSLIFRRTDKVEMVQMVQAYFRHIGFKGVLKVDGETINAHTEAEIAEIQDEILEEAKLLTNHGEDDNEDMDEFINKMNETLQNQRLKVVPPTIAKIIELSTTIP